MYLFVFTFTESRCRCSSNKDGTTQKEHLDLLLEEKRKCITHFFSIGRGWKANQQRLSYPGRLSTKDYFYGYGQSFKGPGQRGHIVADTNVSPFSRTRNIWCGHKFCVRDTKHVSDFVQKPFCVCNKCFPVCAAWKHNIHFVSRVFARPKNVTSNNDMCPQQCILVFQGLK